MKCIRPLFEKLERSNEIEKKKWKINEKKSCLVTNKYIKKTIKIIFYNNKKKKEIKNVYHYYLSLYLFIVFIIHILVQLYPLLIGNRTRLKFIPNNHTKKREKY